jgi:rubrerythrin
MPHGSKTVSERLSSLRDLRRIEYSSKNGESSSWIFGDDAEAERAWTCLKCGHDWNATPAEIFVRKVSCPFCKRGSELCCPRGAGCATCLARSAAAPETARELEEGGVRILRGPRGQVAEEMRVVAHFHETAVEGALTAFECVRCGKLFRDLLSRVATRKAKCIRCPGPSEDGVAPRAWSAEAAAARRARAEKNDKEPLTTLAAEFEKARVRLLRGPDGEIESEVFLNRGEKKTFADDILSTFECFSCGKMWRERAYDVATRKHKCKKCRPLADGLKPREWRNGAPLAGD